MRYAGAMPKAARRIEPLRPVRALRVKLLVALVGLLLFVIVAVAVPLWWVMDRQIVEDIRRELSAIAATAALHIDGDLHHKLATTPDRATFVALRDQLAEVRDELRLPPEQIYTFYVNDADPELLHFAVMTHEVPFSGDPYPVRDEMRPALERGEVAASGLYEDEHGRWISAYAPIRGSAGEVVGLLEVDRVAGAYVSRARWALWLTLTTGVTVLITGLVLARWMLRRVIGLPLEAIHGGVEALSRRDFSHRIGLQTRDELQDLADALDDVAGQLDAARTVQSSLIPDTLPQGGGWSLAGTSLPCDATGGDYFDAFELPEGRIGVVVGDVTGHGLGPSLLMSSCRSALMTILQGGHARGPAAVVDRLAAACEWDLTGGKFITLIYGELSPDGTFTYANAGHGPTLVRCGTTVERLVTHRPPLGIPWQTPAGESAQDVVRLSPGDRLLLASDGVPEAFDAGGDMYGEDRLRAAVLGSADPPAVFVERLLGRVRAHCAGEPWVDDVTVVCVDRVGDAGRVGSGGETR